MNTAPRSAAERRQPGRHHHGRTSIAEAGSFQNLLADKGYDTDHFKQDLAERQAEAVIPARARRKHPASYDRIAYRDRNTVESLWARLKDYRRVATRYDKRADTFLSGVLIAAIICYWIK